MIILGSKSNKIFYLTSAEFVRNLNLQLLAGDKDVFFSLMWSATI